ncbi:MAG: modification methylase, partial [Helicobacter sp.]|nr:modification methylase [Helicobacter sp.]
IFEIAKVYKKRALEVSRFYFDLETSIKSMLDSMNRKGKVFFVVGNRRVKNILLPTDRFITEVFCRNGFRHLQTIRRKISNKSMPLQNSPSNRSGAISSTMNEEYIVVCEKHG